MMETDRRSRLDVATAELAAARAEYERDSRRNERRLQNAMEKLRAAGEVECRGKGRKPTERAETAMEWEIGTAIGVAHRTITRHAPQYEHLLRHVEHRYHPGLRAVAVTNGSTIGYGPEFALPAVRRREYRETLPDNAALISDQAYIVVHELLHVALEHPLRQLECRKRGREMNPDIANLCADAIVNQIIDEWQPNGIRPRPDRVGWPELSGIALRLMTIAECDMPASLNGKRPRHGWRELHDDLVHLVEQAREKSTRTKPERIARIKRRQISLRDERRLALAQADMERRFQHPERYTEETVGDVSGTEDAINLGEWVGDRGTIRTEDINEYCDIAVEHLLAPKPIIIRISDGDLVMPTEDQAEHQREQSDHRPILIELGGMIARIRAEQGGTGPSPTLAETIERMNREMNWREIVRPILTEWLWRAPTPTPERPSRAYTANLAANLPAFWSPGYRRNEPGGRLGILIDTSASIDQHDLRAFIGHLDQMVRTLRSPITVIAGGAEVDHRWDDVEGKLEMVQGLKLKSGGGTDFRPLLQEAENAGCAGAVYLTDGYGNFGEKGSMDVIWGLLPDTTSPERVPWGRTVVVRS